MREMMRDNPNPYYPSPKEEWCRHAKNAPFLPSSQTLYFLLPSPTSSCCVYNRSLETMASPPPELNVIAVSFSLAVNASITDLFDSAKDVDAKRSEIMYHTMS